MRKCVNAGMQECYNAGMKEKEKRKKAKGDCAEELPLGLGVREGMRE
jgi:hypothetical protein